MKKALVVLLILAVAGGVFAQTTVKVTGNVRTGLAIGFTDEDGDAGKAKVDYIQNKGENGMRADLGVQVRSGDENSPYGKFGADFTLRAREGALFGADTFSQNLNAPTANIFWQPSSLLWIQVGTGGGGGFGTLGGIDRNHDIVDTGGLKLKLTPIAGLTIGAQAYYGATGATKLFETVNYGFGAKYSLPILDVAANLRYLAENTADKTEKIRFGAGANIKALASMGLNALAADVNTYGFGTDNFFLGVGEKVGFSASGLSLTVKAQEYLWMGTGDKDVIPMLFQGEVSYQVSSLVKVGAEVRYIIGNKPSFNYRNASEIGGVDNVAAFSAKETAGLGVSPWVSFAVGPEVILGLNLQKDMSNGASGKTQTILIYTGVNLSY